MGWDVDLIVDDEVAIVKSHQEGSNIALGGTDEASMCVTYNYSRIYIDKLACSVADFLKDKMASETIQFLKDGIAKIGTANPTSNYWEATLGNAGHILAVLLDWANQHPRGTWRISK